MVRCYYRVPMIARSEFGTSLPSPASEALYEVTPDMSWRLISHPMEGKSSLVLMMAR